MQDTIENIFCQVRSKSVMRPKPVQFRLSLRLIRLAQFMAIPSAGSCEVDDTSHLISFIKSTSNKYLEYDKECTHEGESLQIASK